MRLEDLIFIDVEASGMGPGAYPIEVGWADIIGRTGSVLIRPADGWDHWDYNAEWIHGIPRERLFIDGVAPDLAATVVAEAVEGRIAISDNPIFDTDWLRTLFEEARPPTPPPDLIHVQKVVNWIADTRKRTRNDWVKAAAKGREIAPITHRAAVDALSVATAIRLFAEE